MHSLVGKNIEEVKASLASQGLSIDSEKLPKTLIKTRVLSLSKTRSGREDKQSNSNKSSN